MPQYTFDVNAAMKAGYTPDQIQQYLAQQKTQGNDYQLTQTPQATPQQSQQPAPKSNFFADALPTVGGIVGGIAGAAIPGLGETGLGEIGGAAAGSGLGETARELIEGQPLNARDIGTQTALGGVGGVVGKGLGYVAGKVLPKIGQAAPALENAATDLAQGTRQIRVKPSIYGAGEEKAINTTLDKYGVAGTAQQQYSQLQPTMQAIEGKINQFIKNNPDLGASKKDIQDAFMSNLDSSLRSKDLTAEQAKDEINGYLNDLLKASNKNKPVITDEMQNVITKSNALKSQIQNYEKQISDIEQNGSDSTGRMSNRDIPALQSLADNLNGQLNDLPTIPKTDSTGDNIKLAQLRSLKKLVNEDYGPVYAKAQAGNALTPRQKVISAAWDSLDQSVKNASPEVKGLLTDESNIYKSARSLSAARSNPPTLRIAGTSVPQVVTQTARDIGTNAIKTGGNILGKTPTSLPTVLSQTAGQGATRALLPTTPQGLNQNTQNGQNNPQNNGQSQTSQNNPSSNYNQNTLPSSPSQAFGNNSTINSPQSQANPLQGYTINGQPIDPAMANLIYKVATYQLDPTKMTSLKNNERERIVSLASQFDPSYDSSQFPVKQKIRDDFATGKSAQNVKAINTAISHLSELAQSGNELNNGSIPLLNEAKNAFTSGTGNAAPNNFETDADAVAGEMSNIFKATGGTDAEISAWRQHFKADMSPAQQQGAIKKAIGLMAGRLAILQSQYKQGLGSPTNYNFLNSSSQAILQNFGIDPNSLTQQGQ